jgi:hypothetical protein
MTAGERATKTSDDQSVGGRPTEERRAKSPTTEAKQKTTNGGEQANERPSLLVGGQPTNEGRRRKSNERRPSNFKAGGRPAEDGRAKPEEGKQPLLATNNYIKCTCIYIYEIYVCVKHT